MLYTHLVIYLFTPAADAGFDFDALLQHVIDAKDSNGDDLDGYEIKPVVPGPDCLPPASSAGPPAPTPPIQLHIPPPISTPAPTPARSRHTPPKPGTNESAYQKARGKAHEKLKAKQCKETTPYGDFVVKPRIVNKHIKKPEKLICTGLNAMDMPHASTRYLGKRDSGGAKHVDEPANSLTAYFRNFRIFLHSIGHI
jgi:hypothetical protein